MAASAVEPPCDGVDKAWPLALARAARDGMALRLEVAVVTVQRLSLTELLELPPEHALIAVLEGPGDGLGVIMLAPPVLAGLIEAQTTGKVATGPLTTRKPTRTDGAMVAEFLDRALEGLETALLAADDLIWAGGFRYASFMDDPRPLGLLLDDVPYRLVQAEVSLGGGAKSGSVLLALPAEGRGRRPQKAGQAVPEAAAGMVFSAALGEQVMASTCALEAVLYRMTIPLSAVMGLKPGEVVPLPRAALDQIRLEGIGGRRLGAGKLGQNRGMRAVRLTAEAGIAVPDPAVAGAARGQAPAQAAHPVAEQSPRLTGTG
ncbi:MAG: FliM/FliN family flagellar motor switch protein [Pseudorhodobacter sp.]|nr:FliM/FliN family flagellar motor switch protein [Pseudorhodobacter sp.]